MNLFESVSSVSLLFELGIKVLANPTNSPLSLRDIFPRGGHPSVKICGLPASLSGEPLLILANCMKKIFVYSLP